MNADNSLNFRYCRSFCHLEVNSTHYFDQTIYTIGAPYLAKNSCVITATGSLQKQKRQMIEMSLCIIYDSAYFCWNYRSFVFQ